MVTTVFKLGLQIRPCPCMEALPLGPHPCQSTSTLPWPTELYHLSMRCSYVPASRVCCPSSLPRHRQCGLGLTQDYPNTQDAGAIGAILSSRLQQTICLPLVALDFLNLQLYHSYLCLHGHMTFTYTSVVPSSPLSLFCVFLC